MRHACIVLSTGRDGAAAVQGPVALVARGSQAGDRSFRRRRRRPRFPEFADPGLRGCFVALDLVQTGCWLTGYLEKMQRQLRLAVLSVDRPRLAQNVRMVVAELTATVGPPLPTGPVVDLSRLDTAVSDDVYPRIAAALAEATAVVGGPADERALTRHLAVFDEQVGSEQDRIRAAALTAWAAPTGPAGGLAALESRLRDAGVGLPDGLHEIEKACAAVHRRPNGEKVL
jgi:hypothetical protein